MIKCLYYPHACIQKPLNTPHMMYFLFTCNCYSNLNDVWNHGNTDKLHYVKVIMGAIASQITSLTIVYSTVYSEFPAQMASNAEKVSIWWRHHVLFPCDTSYFDEEDTCTLQLQVNLRVSASNSSLWSIRFTPYFFDFLNGRSWLQTKYIKALMHWFKQGVLIVSYVQFLVFDFCLLF